MIIPIASSNGIRARSITLLACALLEKEMADSNRVETMFREVISLLKQIDEKLDDALYDEATTRNEEPVPMQSRNEFISDENEIRQNGQKIPYNKIEGRDQIREFRIFLSYVRMHEHEFSSKEYEFAGYADKNFPDIRISDNSRRILGTAYQRHYRKPWEFRFKRGYMYKYQNQMAWEWDDGSTD